ncbi:MAG: hypothetical protein ACT4TC_03870 [Myxococcaceae bacterium]
MKIQFLSFPGCPNADEARTQLRGVLLALGCEVSFEDVDTSTSWCDPDLKRWASPTILVEGRDIEGRTAMNGGCRLYASVDGLTGVPPAQALRLALELALSASPDAQRAAMSGRAAMDGQGKEPES